VNASYRLGLTIILGTILASAALAYGVVNYVLKDSRPRVGQDLGDLGYDLGSFRMVERSGKTVTDADLYFNFTLQTFFKPDTPYIFKPNHQVSVTTDVAAVTGTGSKLRVALIGVRERLG